MNPVSDSTVNELEQKFQEIRQKRILLESEFTRIEREYKQLVAKIAALKDQSQVVDLHNKISEI